jgi:hypothetical protein
VRSINGAVAIKVAGEEGIVELDQLHLFTPAITHSLPLLIAIGIELKSLTTTIIVIIHDTMPSILLTPINTSYSLISTHAPEFVLAYIRA